MCDPAAVLPDAGYFMARARAVIDNLPLEFRESLSNVVLVVADFATPDQLASVDVSDKWDLSGLYEGIPLPEQSTWQSGDLPPRISLFCQPLLAECRNTGVPLDDLIRQVTIHEAGHHFGFSDEDMHDLEEQA